jgi:hypothetical protein
LNWRWAACVKVSLRVPHGFNAIEVVGYLSVALKSTWRGVKLSSVTSSGGGGSSSGTEGKQDNKGLVGEGGGLLCLFTGVAAGLGVESVAITAGKEGKKEVIKQS